MFDYGAYIAPVEQGRETLSDFLARILADWRDEKISDLQMDDCMAFAVSRAKSLESAND